MFGCACFPLIHSSARHKLKSKSVKCIFLGYDAHYKGYQCYNCQHRQIIVSRHVLFDKSSFPFATSQCSNSAPVQLTSTSSSLLILVSLSSASHPNSKFSDSATTGQHIQPSISITPPGSIPISNNMPQLSASPVLSADNIARPMNSHPMITGSRTGSLKLKQQFSLVHSNPTATIPFSYLEEIKSPHWNNAMLEEIKALHKQDTWELVPRPPLASVLGSWWVFKLKPNSDGSIAHYKARLVAQGNRREYDIDYDDTFSPVVKMPMVRILLTIVVHHKWEVRQLDVSNVFLHCAIDTIVYMKQPQCFVDSSLLNHVCLLHKAI